MIWKKIIFENSNFSENNIISVKLAKGLGYVAGIVGKCWVGCMETMKIIGGPFKKWNARPFGDEKFGLITCPADTKFSGNALWNWKLLNITWKNGECCTPKEIQRPENCLFRHVIPSEIPNTGEMERVDTKFPKFSVWNPSKIPNGGEQV